MSDFQKKITRDTKGKKKHSLKRKRKDRSIVSKYLIHICSNEILKVIKNLNAIKSAAMYLKICILYKQQIMIFKSRT